jgi:hypothetical protein
MQHRVDPRSVPDAALAQPLGAASRVVANELALGAVERLALALQRILQLEHADVHREGGGDRGLQCRRVHAERAAHDAADHRDVDRMPCRIASAAIEQRRRERGVFAGFAGL